MNRENYHAAMDVEAAAHKHSNSQVPPTFLFKPLLGTKQNIHLIQPNSDTVGLNSAYFHPKPMQF